MLGGVIDGDTGKDTIKLNSGKDVVKISTTSNDNMKNIIDFDVADDILSFKSTAFGGLANLDRIGDLKSVGSTDVNVTSATVTTVYKGTYADLTTHLKGNNTSDGKVVVAVATDADNEGIYAVTLASNAAPSSVVKVGTLDDASAYDALTMANFALFA